MLEFMINLKILNYSNKGTNYNFNFSVYEWLAVLQS